MAFTKAGAKVGTAVIGTKRTGMKRTDLRMKRKITGGAITNAKKVRMKRKQL